MYAMSIKTLRLECHPTAIPDIDMSINVIVRECLPDEIVLTYRLLADFRQLKLPRRQVPERPDELWRHTCFEAFVMAQGSAGYREFNFSPSGAWQLYEFEDYRQGGEAGSGELPLGRLAICFDGIVFEQRIPTELMPAGDKLQLGLSAVVERANGDISYWALKHPTAQPDFHHHEAFDFSLSMHT